MTTIPPLDEVRRGALIVAACAVSQWLGAVAYMVL